MSRRARSDKPPSPHLSRAWAEFQEAALAEARARGAIDPVLWVEAEAGLYVVDRAHPAYDNGPGVGPACVVLYLGGPVSGGAW